ncbi:MAG: hypothetical protein ACKVPX_07705 [Myxococcaceae bacterium]
MIGPLPPSPPPPASNALDSLRPQHAVVATVTTPPRTLEQTLKDTFVDLPDGRRMRLEVPAAHAEQGVAARAVLADVQVAARQAGQVRVDEGDEFVSPEDAMRAELKIRLMALANSEVLVPAFAQVRASNKRVLNANGTSPKTDDEFLLAAARDIAVATWRRAAQPSSPREVREVLWPGIETLAKSREAWMILQFETGVRAIFNPGFSYQVGSQEVRSRLVRELDPGRTGIITGRLPDELRALITDFMIDVTAGSSPR